MNLFKLKKDGKTVGYEQHALLTPDNYIVILHSKHCRWSALGCYNITIYPDKFIIHNEKCPFVCKDKNGKKIWAGDKTNCGIAIAAYEDWVWLYQKDHSTYRWNLVYVGDIELIKVSKDV